MKMDTRKLAGNKRPLEDNIAAPASKRKNENESTIFRPKGKLEKVKDLLPLGMNISRKALRKEMRQIKKARRHAHYTRQAMPTLQSKLTKQYDEQLAKQEAAKLAREKLEKKRQKNAAKRLAREERKKAYEKAEKLRIEKEEEERRIVFEENREIKELEKQLHMNKRKSKSLPKKFVEEGLDYILDAIDPEKVNETLGKDDEQHVWTAADSGDEDGENLSDIEEASEDEMGSSDEELGTDEDDELELNGESGDEDVGSGDENMEAGAEDMESGDEDMESGDEDVGSGDDDMGSGEGQLLSDNDEIASDDDQIELDGGEMESDANNENCGSEADSDDEDTNLEAKDGQSSLKEDIYGRLRDSSGNVVTGGTYVPPARRRELLEGADESTARQLRLDKLKKQLKGQLNRLSEHNMVSISKYVETLYRENSRADMNTCLQHLVAESALTDIMTPERLSMELAMLIALLHNNIGTEIGATFLEVLSEMFNSLHSKANEDNSKKIHNVTSFLCHLYSFQVTHSVLIIDMMNELIDSFRDVDIELILIMLRSVGFTLKKEDSGALKELIFKTQKKANDADIDSYTDKSRVKFMLEVVLAIKNNNIRKIPNYDTSHMDHLKKLLRGFVKGGTLATGQLRITYRDLLSAKNKGKWWVVGSAWEGSQAAPNLSSTNTTVSQSKVSNKFSNNLLELARKQRMNTDTRRNIFCTMMSAEDFMDAFEKLLKLGLNTKQEREIITVAVECCANETVYNAYYTHLLNKFISYHRRFLFTFQTTMWDRFKIMSTMSDSGIQNLAQLTGHLIVEQTLPLAVLKNLEFGELDKSLVKFLKALLLRIFKSDKKTILDIFFKIGSSGSKLKPVKEGLELFMHHFLLRKCKNEKERSRLEMCVAAAENGLSMNRDAAMF